MADFIIPTAFSSVPDVTGQIPSWDNSASGGCGWRISDNCLEPGHRNYLLTGHKFTVQKLSHQLLSFSDSVVLFHSASLTNSAQFYPDLLSIINVQDPGDSGN